MMYNIIKLLFIISFGIIVKKIIIVIKPKQP